MSLLKTYYKSVFSFLVVAILIGYSGNEAAVSLKTPNTCAWILDIQASSSDECFSYDQNAIDSIEYSLSFNRDFYIHSSNKTKTAIIAHQIQLRIYNHKKHRLEQSMALRTSSINTSTTDTYSSIG